MQDNQTRKVLLKVEHLEKHFKLGKLRTLKAVNDVSFEIYKGEVFGLVGESGCGKSTTGRTIIRLEDATGGSVYFDGKRIVAGTRTYKEAIIVAKQNYKEKCKQLKIELNQAKQENDLSKIEQINEKLVNEKVQLDEIVSNNLAEIKKAKYDHKYCNKEFGKAQAAAVAEKYESLIASETDPEKIKQLEEEYKAEYKLAKKDRIMNKIQMIFQDPIASLDPRMTVRDIIAEGLIIRGHKDKEWIDQQVFKILETVGLVSEHANRYPHEFSGGQRQRIGIARAIILNPELIIADEPISALDVSIQAQVINLLNELSEKMGLTTLFIAHDLAVVKYFSHRIAVMYYGKIVELATSDELFKHPFHPYTRSLLSAIPLPDPYNEKKRTRITYNPLQDHDYTKQAPRMQEVYPGHFVLCNDEELAKYKKELEE